MTWFKMIKIDSNRKNTLWEKENKPVTGSFSFSHIFFRKHLSCGFLMGLCGKGLGWDLKANYRQNIKIIVFACSEHIFVIDISRNEF